MFRIESYVTPILLSYVDKYVKDFKPADAQVSLWGGGVVLHNLVLKTDVLQKEVPLPFTLVSGRIHELLIQVPWTKIMSEPIVVTIDTIECILNRRVPEDVSESPPENVRKSQEIEAPPGYMQALVRRIVNNISIKIHHLIVKYVQDDIVLSLNVNLLSIDSAGADWKQAFADITPSDPVIRRLVTLDDLTLCLDSTDSDGKIRFYQDPLLYRCNLQFRVLTRLVSANTRRACNVDVELHAENLAWGITSDQLLLVLRLIKERVVVAETPSPTSARPTINKPSNPNDSMDVSAKLQRATTSNKSEEPVRSESWSDWAWSWMPWTSRGDDKEETPMGTQPTPLAFSAYLDEVSLVFKLMEMDANYRKRQKKILELYTAFVAIKCNICVPTLMRAKMGIRYILLQSQGKCPCDLETYLSNEPTVYFRCREKNKETWNWPVNEKPDDKVEVAEIAKEAEEKDKTKPTTSDAVASQNNEETKNEEVTPEAEKTTAEVRDKRRETWSFSLNDFVETFMTRRNIESDHADEKFWKKMSPVIFVDFLHERSPPDIFINPYESPPTDFEYSDWEEECDVRVTIQPIDLRICLGFIHRLSHIANIFGEIPPADIEPMRRLTVEECEALYQNIAQRRTNVEITNLRIMIHPWDHSSTSERPFKTPLVLEIEISKGNLVVIAPLYTQRVCSAAAQIPVDEGPLWQGCRMHTVAAFKVQVSVSSPTEDLTKPCGRFDVRLVTHQLLYPEYFRKKLSILFSYAVKIREASISGSAARLHAAMQVPMSWAKKRISKPLLRTTLAKDALRDEDLVALDITIEDVEIRGFLTRLTKSHIMTLQSVRATVFQKLEEPQKVNQAWLFSGPDISTSTPFIRMAVQWCEESFPGSVDLFGLWTEPTAIAIDPLLIQWLSYKPYIKTVDSGLFHSRSFLASQQLLNRRSTPPSSSGRGLTRSTSDAEQVHIKPRSNDSSSERSERKSVAPPAAPTETVEPWWKGEALLKLHERLKGVLICIELGLVFIYVPTQTVSALNCETIFSAMKEHSISQSVMVLSAGRWSLSTNNNPNRLWHSIQQDGPTFVKVDKDKEQPNSFPWRMSFEDVSCYTLEPPTPDENLVTEYKSQLKAQGISKHCTILELNSTTIILSVVTKTLQTKITTVPVKQKKSKEPQQSKSDAKLKYFTSGPEFKPQTFLDFLRGPARRKKEISTQSDPTGKPETSTNGPEVKVVDGPIVSMGFNMHADTPPVMIRMEKRHLQQLASTIHCFKHLITLVKQSPTHVARQSSFAINIASKLSRTEMDDDQTSRSESLESRRSSNLLTIFVSNPHEKDISEIKTFVLFQWVISRISVLITAENVRLSISIDDVMSSIDLQEHYNQFKIKIASASIKQYERSEDQTWMPGVLNGRILETCEPMNFEEDFLAVTITQAEIAKLPDSWKAELHPKLLEQESGTMWEVYAVLAPLEVIIAPNTLNNILHVINALNLERECSLQQFVVVERYQPMVNLPYCYVNAGGLKIMMACDTVKKDEDDTIIISIRKISVIPHPENPICRRPLTAGESGWSSVAGNMEGQQYELAISSITVKTTKFFQLVTEQETSADKGIHGENPAHKWSRPAIAPDMVTCLHPLNLQFLYAPPLFVNGAMICGSAVEFNITNDMVLEVEIEQLCLFTNVIRTIQQSLHERMAFGKGRANVCPYAYVKQQRYAFNLDPVGSPRTSTTVINEDSGMDTATSRSTFKFQDTITKKTSYVSYNPDENLEVFITTGLIDLSLYCKDDQKKTETDENKEETVVIDTMNMEDRRFGHKDSLKDLRKDSPISLTSKDTGASSKNTLPGTARRADIAITHGFKVGDDLNLCIRNHVPQLIVKFYQPNLYYWKHRSQTNLQVSLFNFGISIGLNKLMFIASPFLSTAKGVPDPVTEIPPALATMKYTAGSIGSSFVVNQRNCLTLDIERPIHIEASDEKVRQLIHIYMLIKNSCFRKVKHTRTIKNDNVEEPSLPAMYKLRNVFQDRYIDTATIQMTQIGVSVAKAIITWDSASLQILINNRRDQIGAHALIKALMFTPEIDDCGSRQPILHPTHIGLKLNSSWESWQRAEGGESCKQPTTRLLVDTDITNIDLNPNVSLSIISNALDLINELKDASQVADSGLVSDDDFEENEEEVPSQTDFQTTSPPLLTHEEPDIGVHYYKDDLRSGAFQIVNGAQMPMAYQAILHKNIISWKYPHPRAITKLVIYPLPNQSEEINCALEFYNYVTCSWTPFTYIKLPVHEPRELLLQGQPPGIIFATIWRFRVIPEDDNPVRYEFDIMKFMPGSVYTWLEDTEPTHAKLYKGITAEQLSGILRVDSCFGPTHTPRIKLCVRCARTNIHLNNSLPDVYKQAPGLEGYYLSKPLLKCHRIFTLSLLDTIIDCSDGALSGKLILFKSDIASDILECSTGTMSPMTNNFTLQAALTVPQHLMEMSRLRLCATSIKLGLNITRLRTCQVLAKDWQKAIGQHVSKNACVAEVPSQQAVEDQAPTILEGLVSLWVHNSCSVSLKIGQEGTDEVLPLASGVKMAYRWRNPDEPKKIRFAFASPTADWRWSNSISFEVGDYRIRMEDSVHENTSTNLYIETKQIHGHRIMRIAGKLILANMLKLNIVYKVKARLQNTNAKWTTISSGDIGSESYSRSIIAALHSDLVLKIRFQNHDTGWSGDIPMRECPKENVPWLVKIPFEGDAPYVSVWCRIVRARCDNRIVAAIWPLYVLRSHLTLDTDLLITTDAGAPNTATPLMLSATGRGNTTHLLAPGTTSAKHSISFQYRDIECPVTRDAVPLHYGITDTSVFDKRVAVNTTEEVLQEYDEWLKRSRSQKTHLSWPYSTVAKHIQEPWQSSFLQPRAEISVKYQAIRVAGSGCSLEIQLSPVLLFCNATPTELVIRAHDAAPVCKIEAGKVIAVPSIILKKPFFVSIQMNRETFVSEQLEICTSDPGRYGTPPHGQVAIEHPTVFAILSGSKTQVTLLKLHYDIKEEINILGVTAPFFLVNKLDTRLYISLYAVSEDVQKTKVIFSQHQYKMIEPSKPDKVIYVPLCQYWLYGHWRVGDKGIFATYLVTSLVNYHVESTGLPIRFGNSTLRRSMALVNEDGVSVPVVVTHHVYEGRNIVTVSPDPCPQYLVVNRSSYPVVIGQPHPQQDNTNNVKVMEECPGVLWRSVIEPKQRMFYSGPGYDFQSPMGISDVPQPVQFLTFSGDSSIHGKSRTWCQPVAVTPGKQLVQLNPTVTIKMHVEVYPHSTLIELHDIDTDDISASDIRKRLDHYSYTSILLPTRIPMNEGQDDFLLYGGYNRQSQIQELDSELQQLKLKANRLLSDGSEIQKIQALYITSSENHINDIRSVKHSSTEREDSFDKNLDSETSNKEYKNPLIDVQKDDRKSKNALTVSIQENINDESKNVEDSMPQNPSENNNTQLDKKCCYYSDKNVQVKECQSNNRPSEDTLIKVRKGPPDSINKINEWDVNTASDWDRVRCMIMNLSVEMAVTDDTRPLVALHVDQTFFTSSSSNKKLRTRLSIADIQMDNLQYDSGQYDFAVIATTRGEGTELDSLPTFWTMFLAHNVFTQHDNSRVLLKTCYENWTVLSRQCSELTEVDFQAGPLALFVEDAFVTDLIKLTRLADSPSTTNDDTLTLAEAKALQKPLRLRLFYIHPIDLTLTLHTAVRMYIALDQSPLHLNAFKQHHMFTTMECLVHTLTVHYLSAAVLGAGWMVGGLELLGAPGALAARVGGARGGVRGVASTAAAALLRSMAACAGSLARNLDLLAGDEEHARRAAAARRRPPHNLLAGLFAGFTNFAINILGAVGGLAHHPLVGVAVGETDSSALALRRGILGALTKPLSATADLVAYAGQGLLAQTGWDSVPQPRPRTELVPISAGWRRDSVRWTFRLAELGPMAGFEVLLHDMPLQVLITDKYIVVTESQSERVVEMLELRHCSLGPYEGGNIELYVAQKRPGKWTWAADEDIQISETAMQRVAAYTGADRDGSAGAAAVGGGRLLTLEPSTRQSASLHAMLLAAIHNNSDTHFAFM